MTHSRPYFFHLKKKTQKTQSYRLWGLPDLLFKSPHVTPFTAFQLNLFCIFLFAYATRIMKSDICMFLVYCRAYCTEMSDLKILIHWSIQRMQINAGHNKFNAWYEINKVRLLNLDGSLFPKWHQSDNESGSKGVGRLWCLELGSQDWILDASWVEEDTARASTLPPLPICTQSYFPVAHSVTLSLMVYPVD